MKSVSFSLFVASFCGFAAFCGFLRRCGFLLCFAAFCGCLRLCGFLRRLFANPVLQVLHTIHMCVKVTEFRRCAIEYRNFHSKARRIFLIYPGPAAVQLTEVKRPASCTIWRWDLSSGSPHASIRIKGPRPLGLCPQGSKGPGFPASRSSFLKFCIGTWKAEG